MGNDKNVKLGRSRSSMIILYLLESRIRENLNGEQVNVALDTVDNRRSWYFGINNDGPRIRRF